MRSGLTTGTCAAAAAKAATLALAGRHCAAVDVGLPGGDTVTLAIENLELVGDGRARAAVRKDAGDDPDVTNGMLVAVEVELRGEAGAEGDEVAVTFAAGPGVGTVTQPGLQLAPGEPAINPVPRAMIAAAVREALAEADGAPAAEVHVIVSIAGGEDVALQTFNPRLGIERGLSVLGTSGRVVPKSEEAWKRSLLPQIDVALAAGERTVYLVPGGFGERVAREELEAPEAAIVHCSNFVGDLLDGCVERGVERVVLVGHIGKVTKLAAGMWNTHSRHGDTRLETVAALAGAAGAPAPLVARLLDLPTAEAAVQELAAAGLEDVWDDVAERAAHRGAERAARKVALLAAAAKLRPDAGAAGAAGAQAAPTAAPTATPAVPRVDCVVSSYDGQVIGRSAGLRAAEAATHAAAAVEAALDATLDAVPDTAGPVDLTVVGIGPGAEEWLTPAAWRAIRGAEVLVGGRRQLDGFAPAGARQIEIGASMVDLVAELHGCSGLRAAVLASGDPGFFSIAATLRRLLPAAHMTVLPGISSAQLAMARLGRPWQDVTFASAHGTDLAAVVAVATERPLVLALCDARNTPQALATALYDAGLEVRLTVLERLGEPDETITEGSPARLASGTFDGLAVVFIEREERA